MDKEQISLVHSYFVDEAGDLTLFNKKGQTLLGQAGVSYFFMVGVAHVADPTGAQARLDTLRQELLTDPYFAKVPSMQPGQKKTALAFHAKDDLPEVRREVFKLLPQLEAKVQVAIRSKSILTRDAQTLYRYQRHKLDANDVYDGLVKRLFQNLLHKADHNQITFARRGTSDRSEALYRAMRLAKQNFAAKWGNRGDTPTTIASAHPHEAGGLQIIDYYLWALQRLYERREARFFDLLAQDYRLIMDLDDKRHKPYGTWYSDSNPLMLEKLAWTFPPKK